MLIASWDKHSNSILLVRESAIAGTGAPNLVLFTILIKGSNLATVKCLNHALLILLYSQLVRDLLANFIKAQQADCLSREAMGNSESTKSQVSMRHIQVSSDRDIPL